jgi:hypothetical protein
MMHMQDGKSHSSRHSLMDATQQRAINNLKRHNHTLETHTQTTPQTHTHGEASPVKSLRLVIKNRVKTYMKTRTKKLKVCDAQ